MAVSHDARAEGSGWGWGGWKDGRVRPFFFVITRTFSVFDFYHPSISTSQFLLSDILPEKPKIVYFFLFFLRGGGCVQSKTTLNNQQNWNKSPDVCRWYSDIHHRCQKTVVSSGLKILEFWWWSAPSPCDVTESHHHHNLHPEPLLMMFGSLRAHCVV